MPHMSSTRVNCKGGECKSGGPGTLLRGYTFFNSRQSKYIYLLNLSTKCPLHFKTFDAKVRRAVDFSHELFGEVTNQITSFKSPIFLNKMKNEMICQNDYLFEMFIATELYITFW